MSHYEATVTYTIEVIGEGGGTFSFTRKSRDVVAADSYEDAKEKFAEHYANRDNISNVSIGKCTPVTGPVSIA